MIILEDNININKECTIYCLKKRKCKTLYLCILADSNAMTDLLKRQGRWGLFSVAGGFV